MGGCCDVGTYECQEIACFCECCGRPIYVDKCIAKEVARLRDMGIRTLGSCCGHGKLEPSIVVDERDDGRMEELGYELHVNEYGAHEFRAKSLCERGEE